MYSRSTKIIFSFMAFLMAIGYIALVLTGIPSFQQAFTGSSSGRNATIKQLDDAKATVKRRGCREGMKADKATIAACKEALLNMAAAYRTLSVPEEQGADSPPNADHYLDRMLEAYRIRMLIAPRDAEARADYASALRGMGKPKEALLIFRELSREKPKDPQYAAAYADAAQAAGETDESTKAWKSFLKRFPNDANVENAREALKQIKEQAAAGGGAANSLTL